MKKKNIYLNDKIILELEVLAKEKEAVRKKLAVTAEELRLKAKQLAVTAKEKETVRRKLAVTAEELRLKAKQLAVTAKEKETVRRKLAVTAEELRLKAKQLAVTAKEKETVRRKLAVTAKELKRLHETLEEKVFERTKDLEQTKARNEAILASIGDGLVVVDKEGKISYINKSFEEMLGWKAQEIIGKSMIEVVPREDLNGLEVSFKERILTLVLSGEKFIADLANSFYYIRKNKTRFPASSIVAPVVLDGKIVGAVEVFRDITKEKEIDKAKTEFVSLASHQLRTPLTTTSWYTEMILSGDVGKVSKEQKKYLQEIHRSNQRMVELVNTLLDVSRIELGTLLIEPTQTDIIALAQSVLDEQKPRIEEKKLVLVQKLNKESSMFLTDSKLLRMVFQNLLTNAVSYTPTGGRIEFTISFDDKKSILIKVSDTGYGIPKNQQHQIFAKLFRADNVRDKDTGGTGLGLYIVKSIVENSGGKIWFESPHGNPTVIAKKSVDGEETPGTTFYVTLPLKSQKKPISASSLSNPAKKKVRK